MSFSLVITFILGVAVGMFLGVIGLSLCFIGKRTDAMENFDAPRSDALS
ncbi:MAG: hypothetical protein HZB51_15495 [Chloroflexi bacterium]|nr:hypothetical protein [Chloroflexota bacterium]